MIPGYIQPNIRDICSENKYITESDFGHTKIPNSSIKKRGHLYMKYDTLSFPHIKVENDAFLGSLADSLSNVFVPQTEEEEKISKEYQQDKFIPYIDYRNILPISPLGYNNFVSSDSSYFDAKDRNYTNLYFFIADKTVYDKSSFLYRLCNPSKRDDKIDNDDNRNKYFYMRHSGSSLKDYIPFRDPETDDALYEAQSDSENRNVAFLNQNYSDFISSDYNTNSKLDNITPLKTFFNTKEDILSDQYKYFITDGQLSTYTFLSRGRKRIKNNVFIEELVSNKFSDMQSLYDNIITHTISSSQQRSLVFEKDLGIHPIFNMGSFELKTALRLVAKPVMDSSIINGTLDIKKVIEELTKQQTQLFKYDFGDDLAKNTKNNSTDDPIKTSYLGHDVSDSNVAKFWPSFVSVHRETYEGDKFSSVVDLSHFGINKIYGYCEGFNKGEPSVIFDSQLHNVALIEPYISRYLHFHAKSNITNQNGKPKLYIWFLFNSTLIMSERSYNRIKKLLDVEILALQDDNVDTNANVAATYGGGDDSYFNMNFDHLEKYDKPQTQPPLWYHSICYILDCITSNTSLYEEPTEETKNGRSKSLYYRLFLTAYCRLIHHIIKKKMVLFENLKIEIENWVTLLPYVQHIVKTPVDHKIIRTIKSIDKKVVAETVKGSSAKNDIYTIKSGFGYLNEIRSVFLDKPSVPFSSEKDYKETYQFGTLNKDPYKDTDDTLNLNFVSDFVSDVNFASKSISYKILNKSPDTYFILDPVNLKNITSDQNNTNEAISPDGNTTITATVSSTTAKKNDGGSLDTERIKRTFLFRINFKEDAYIPLRDIITQYTQEIRDRGILVSNYVSSFLRDKDIPNFIDLESSKSEEDIKEMYDKLKEIKKLDRMDVTVLLTIAKMLSDEEDVFWDQIFSQVKNNMDKEDFENSIEIFKIERAHLTKMICSVINLWKKKLPDCLTDNEYLLKRKMEVLPGFYKNTYIHNENENFKTKERKNATSSEVLSYLKTNLPDDKLTQAYIDLLDSDIRVLESSQIQQPSGPLPSEKPNTNKGFISSTIGGAISGTIGYLSSFLSRYTQKIDTGNSSLNNIKPPKSGFRNDDIEKYYKYIKEQRQLAKDEMDTNTTFSKKIKTGIECEISVDIIDKIIELSCLCGFFKNFILLNHGYMDTHCDDIKALIESEEESVNWSISILDELSTGTGSSFIISPIKGNIERFYKEFRNAVDIKHNPIVNPDKFIHCLYPYDTLQTGPSSLFLHEVPNQSAFARLPFDTDLLNNNARGNVYLDQLYDPLQYMEWAQDPLVTTSQKLKVTNFPDLLRYTIIKEKIREVERSTDLQNVRHYTNKLIYTDIYNKNLDPYKSPINRFVGNGFTFYDIVDSTAAKSENKDNPIYENYRIFLESQYSNMNDGFLTSLYYDPSFSFEDDLLSLLLYERDKTLKDVNTLVSYTDCPDFLRIKNAEREMYMSAKTLEGEKGKPKKNRLDSRIDMTQSNFISIPLMDTKLNQIRDAKFSKSVSKSEFIGKVLMSKSPLYNTLCTLYNISEDLPLINKSPYDLHLIQSQDEQDKVDLVAEVPFYYSLWSSKHHELLSDIVPGNIQNSILINKLHKMTLKENRKNAVQDNFSVKIKTEPGTNINNKNPSSTFPEQKTNVPRKVKVVSKPYTLGEILVDHVVSDIDTVPDSELSFKNKMFRQNSMRRTHFDIVCATIPPLIKYGSILKPMLDGKTWKSVEEYNQVVISNFSTESDQISSKMADYISEFMERNQYDPIAPNLFLLQHRNIIRSKLSNVNLYDKIDNTTGKEIKYGIDPDELYATYYEDAVSYYIQNPDMLNKRKKMIQTNDELLKKNIDLHYYINGSFLRHMRRYLTKCREETQKDETTPLPRSWDLIKRKFSVLNQSEQSYATLNIPDTIGSIETLCPYQIYIKDINHVLNYEIENNNIQTNKVKGSSSSSTLMNNYKSLFYTHSIQKQDNFVCLPIYSLDSGSSCDYFVPPIYYMSKKRDFGSFMDPTKFSKDNPSKQQQEYTDFMGMIKAYITNGGPNRETQLGVSVLAMMALIASLWVVCMTAKMEALETYTPMDILKLSTGRWIDQGVGSIVDIVEREDKDNIYNKIKKEEVRDSNLDSSKKKDDENDIVQSHVYANKHVYDLFEREFTGISDSVIIEASSLDSNTYDPVVLKTTSVRGNAKETKNLQEALEYIYEIPGMYKQHVGHVFSKNELYTLSKPNTTAKRMEEKLKRYQILEHNAVDNSLMYLLKHTKSSPGINLVGKYNKEDPVIQNNYAKMVNQKPTDIDLESYYLDKLIYLRDKTICNVQYNYIKERRERSSAILQQQELILKGEADIYGSKKNDFMQFNNTSSTPLTDTLKGKDLYSDNEAIYRICQPIKFDDTLKENPDELAEDDAQEDEEDENIINNYSIKMPGHYADVLSSTDKMSSFGLPLYDEIIANSGTGEKVNEIITYSENDAFSVATILFKSLNNSVDVSNGSVLSPVQYDSYNVVHSLIKILETGGSFSQRPLDLGSGFTSNMLLNEKKSVIKDILDSSISIPEFDLWKTFPSEAFEISYLESLISDQ